MTQTTKGTFTQLPDVLLMTCDLPDEALMLFIRLFSQTKFQNGTYYGTIRKLALSTHLKRDKAHRNVKALDDAHLAKFETEDHIITLNLDDLWELNVAYHDGIEIPRWTDLEKAVEAVRKIRQKMKEAEQDVREPGQDTQKPDGSVRETRPKSQKPDNPVRPSERKVTAKIGEMNQDTKEESKNVADIPAYGSFSIEDQKQRCWSLWLNVDQNQEVSPDLTPTAEKYLTFFAPRILTQEQMDSLVESTRKALSKQHKRKIWKVALGNMHSHYPEWKHEQESQDNESDTSQDQPQDDWLTSMKARSGVRSGMMEKAARERKGA